MRKVFRGRLLLLFGGLLVAPPARAGSPPAVRFVEVGENGTVFPDAPLFADVEVWSDAPFTGRLLATLGYFTGHARKGPERVLSDRAVQKIALRAGETRRFSMVFPESCFNWRGTRTGEPIEIAWRLVDASGREVARGREPGRSAASPAFRVLALTRESVSCFSRAPADAYTEVSRYLPYLVVLVSRSDLAALGDGQRRALRDAAVVGVSVVIVGPFDAPAPFPDLAAGERVVWADGRGAEIRETPLLRGRVRRTNLPILPPPRLDGLDDPRLLGYALATTAGSLLPRQSGIPHRDAFWLEWAPRADRAFRERIERLALMDLLLVSFVFGTLWVLSRAVRPLGAKSAAIALSAACVGFGLAGRYGHRPAGNIDGDAEICFHDGGGRASLLRSVRVRGGGGGAEVFALATLEPRTALCAQRWVDPVARHRMDVERVAPDTLGLTLDAEAWAGMNIVAAYSDRVRDPDIAWDAHLTWSGSRLTGPITFHRAFRQAALIAKSGAVRLGAVRAGETLEVGSFPVVAPDSEGGLKSMLSTACLRPEIFADASPPLRWGSDDGNVKVFAEEETGGSRVLHVGAVAVEGRPAEEFVFVPAFRRGSELHALVPGLPATRLKSSPAYTFTLQPATWKPKSTRPIPGGTELVFTVRDLAGESMSPRSDLPAGLGLMRFSLEGRP